MQGNQLLANLPDKELKRIQPFMETVEVGFGQHLLEYDRPIDYVWFPDTCVTSTVVNSTDGSTIEVGLMGTEGMVGLSLALGVEVSSATVFAQIAGRATRMRAEHFRKQVLEEGGTLYKLLQRYTNFFMAMIAQTAACNTTHLIEERMCRWILMTHDRVRQDKFPLTHEFLALMLGLRRPSVSKAAGVLKREGLIDYTRGSVTVSDRGGLEARSCECYKIIQGQRSRIFEGVRAGQRCGNTHSDIHTPQSRNQ